MNAAHLNDEQFAGLLLGTGSEEASAHIEACPACRSEMERVRGTLALLARHAQAAAERPAGFWYAQRRLVAERLGERPVQSRLVAWSAAMAVLLFAALQLGQISADPAFIAGPGSTATESVDPDDALMMEIQASLRSPVPRPFEPALLVTQELNRAMESAQSTP